MNAMSSNGPMISRPFSVDNPWISTMETHDTVVLSKSFISSCSKNLTNYHVFLRIYINWCRHIQRDRGVPSTSKVIVRVQSSSPPRRHLRLVAQHSTRPSGEAVSHGRISIFTYMKYQPKINHENVGRYTNRPHGWYGGCNIQKGECRSL